MDDIKIITDKTLELELVAPGESHGICNLLRHILMKDPDVEYAVYSIDHPLVGEPNMTIKTKRGKRPRKVLKKVAKQVQKETDEFKTLIGDL